SATCRAMPAATSTGRPSCTGRATTTPGGTDRFTTPGRLPGATARASTTGTIAGISASGSPGVRSGSGTTASIITGLGPEVSGTSGTSKTTDSPTCTAATSIIITTS